MLQCLGTVFLDMNLVLSFEEHSCMSLLRCITTPLLQSRQCHRLPICFFLICQIVRRLPQPSESGCRIFDGPELKNMCLKEPFFGGLALPHIWNQYWEGFWGHRYITEELGGAFLSLYPTPVASNVWEAVFVQFWLQLDLFWKPDIFLLPLISAQSSFNTSVDTI